MSRIFDGVNFHNMKSSILSGFFWLFPLFALRIMQIINPFILTLLQLLDFCLLFKIIIVKPFSGIFKLLTIFEFKICNLVRLKRAFLNFFSLFYLLTLFDFLVKLLMILIKLLESLRRLYWWTSLRSLNFFNLRYKSALIQLFSFVINFSLFYFNLLFSMQGM